MALSGHPSYQRAYCTGAWPRNSKYICSVSYVWVAVNELSLSHYIGETLLFAIYMYIYPFW